MAAGETPSPEMVANAPSEGLRPVTALLLLLAAAGGLLANAAFWGRTHLAAQIPFEYSPEKLSVIAHETARALGYGERPADAAGGLALSGYPRYAYSQAGSELARRRLASGRPPAITYWYRQSPAILDPGPLPEITSRTPPFDVPGMIRLRLDTAGRLLEFEALPREVEKDRPPPAPPDWSSLFARAGLDASRFTPAAPEWTPRMAFDARAAWTGAWPEAPETSIRIEAASWRGRAVSFRLVAPWTGPTQPLVYGPRSGVSSIVTVLVYIVLPVLAVFLAIRNFKQKRGDVRGATRLGLFVLACDLASMVLGRPHTANSGEIGRLLNWAAQATFHAGIAGTLYVALEPHVRRNWPHALITSTRLLSGRWRDAAVGTHILLGVVAGAGLGLIQCAEALAAAYLGEGPLLGLSWREAIHSLKGARFLAGNLIDNASVPVMILGELFIFLLLRLWLRRNWLAASVWVAFFSLLLPPTADSPLLSFSTWALCLGILITGAIRWRWGLLTLVLADVTMESLTVTPLSLDPSRWYFAYSLFVLLLFFAVALCGFFASLGGRRLLADDLLG
jgi:serine/threonine-protein kinase